MEEGQSKQDFSSFLDTDVGKTQLCLRIKSSSISIFRNCFFLIKQVSKAKTMYYLLQLVCLKMCQWLSALVSLRTSESKKIEATVGITNTVATLPGPQKYSWQVSATLQMASAPFNQNVISWRCCFQISWGAQKSLKIKVT